MAAHLTDVSSNVSAAVNIKSQDATSISIITSSAVQAAAAAQDCLSAIDSVETGAARRLCQNSMVDISMSMRTGV